jgi:hypothetical protein
MDTIIIDTIGPFPADKNESKHVLVILDNFSKFVELMASKDTMANSAAIGIFSFVCRYGTPRRIVSDNGTQFEIQIIIGRTLPT